MPRPYLLACLGLLLSTGCATTRALAPLDKGQHGVNISLGGPFVEFSGAPVPLPFTALGYRYGIDGKTDVHAALYPSSAVLVGVAAWDIGVSRQLLEAAGGRPRIMIDATTYWQVGDNGQGGDPAAFRFFLTPSVVFTWDIGRPKHRVYVGAELFFQPAPTVHALPSLMLGTELQASREVGIQLELGWSGFHRNTNVGAVTWIGPGDIGAIAARLGVNVRIPRPGEGPRARRREKAAREAESAVTERVEGAP